MRSWIEPRWPIESRVRIVKLSIQRCGVVVGQRGVLPPLVQPGHEQRRAVGGVDVVRDLRAVDLLPLVVAGCRHHRASLLERLAEHRLVFELFGARVEGARRRSTDPSPTPGRVPTAPSRAGASAARSWPSRARSRRGRSARRCTTARADRRPRDRPAARPRARSRRWPRRIVRTWLRAYARAPTGRQRSRTPTSSSRSARPAPSDSVTHGTVGRRVVVDRGAATGEHGLGGGEAADRDGRDVAGVLARERRVDLVVVLSVVADQQPLDVRELHREPAQVRELVRLAAAEPAVVRRTPVGQQHRAGREEVAAQEADERRRDVPRAGRQVDHGRARARRARAAP